MTSTFSVAPETVDGQQYLAYLPFLVAPGHTLEPTEGSVSSPYGTHQVKLTKFDEVYALTSGPHASVAEAKEYLEALRGALLWLSLTQSVGLRYSRDLGRLQLYEMPVPLTESNVFAEIFRNRGWDAVDGDYDAQKACIIPDHKRLVRAMCGNPTIWIRIPADNVVSLLREAFSFGSLREIGEEAKLTLAIELYASFRFEASDNAQLLTLVSALEALTPDAHVPAIAQDVIKDVKKLLKQSRSKHDHSTDEYAAIEQLLSRVGKLKREAIGTAMRLYISDIIVRNPTLGDQEHVAAQLKKAYGTRSTLLHEGRVGQAEIGEVLRFLQTFVPRLLTVLFREIAGAAMDIPLGNNEY